MVCLGVRVLIWLLVVCIPAQASVASSLRAKGPAHAHILGNADQADWHRHAHEDSRAAHHDHDAADDSVVLLADSTDDDPGAGGATGKVAVIDLPGALPSALSSPSALTSRDLADSTPVAFESVAGVPLYRPPR